MERLSLTVVVLAGGRGVRMGGVTKPLLADGAGRTLLERIDQALAGLDAERVVVAPAPLAPLLAPAWPHRMVHDLGLGPGAALVRAAYALDTDWLLLVGGDHPAPSARLAARLLTAARRAPDHAVVVRVVGPDGPEPLFALYRRRAVLALCADGAAPPIALRAFGGPGACVELAEASLSAEERAALCDIDTPEEARAAGLDASRAGRGGSAS